MLAAYEFNITTITSNFLIQNPVLKILKQEKTNIKEIWIKSRQKDISLI